MNQPRVLVFTKSKNTSGITLPNSRISFPLTSHSISTKSGAVEGPSLEGSRFWENPNSYIKHVAIFMNQPAPPPPIQSLQNQGPWRVRKSPGFNKIKKFTWHHFAKFKNIHPPHLPLNLYKIRAPGGSQLGRVVVSLILRFVVLTYMGFFSHDLAKPTHMLSNMECQPQRDPFSDFSLVHFLVEAENVVGAEEFNLMCFTTGQQSSSRGS